MSEPNVLYRWTFELMSREYRIVESAPGLLRIEESVKSEPPTFPAQWHEAAGEPYGWPHELVVTEMENRDLRAHIAELRGTLIELRLRLQAAGKRPEECYEMSLIDEALRPERWEERTE